ncbi:response regulator transcription factor [Brevibacillus brevis]|uniref:response regulator transcription factor n=1 Tax=Brevibacillus brevis TaxID=1393 RepID=UPI000AC1D91E|nr:response regulator [Brevibacillus brevis]
MGTILIVEDEIPINELIKRNLQAVGHRCISVMDGKAALEEMDKHKVDLVVLDIMLPEIDGYEVFN